MIMSMAFSPDGKRLASAGYDKMVKVWDTTTGQETVTIRGHTARIYSVAFSANGNRLASASEDSTVKVWDAIHGQETFTFQGNSDHIESMAISPDGKCLASGTWGPDRTRPFLLSPGYPGEVKVWDVLSGQRKLTLTGHTGAVTSVMFSPDGRRLVSASNFDPVARVWDAKSGAVLLKLIGHTGPVNCVAFSPDGTRLASASSDATVKFWDAVSGRETLVLKQLNGVLSVSFSGDGKLVATNGVGQNGNVWGATIVKVWDATSGQEIRTLEGHNDVVNCVAFSPDSKWLATGSGLRFYTIVGGEVKVWNIATGQNTLTLKGHVGAITHVAFSPDGNRLASASGDGYRRGEVKIWDTMSGQETLSLKGHSQEVKSVAFSPDGHRLASAGDWRVRLWDARPWTPELRAEREALSLIHLLQEQGKGKYRSNLIRAISADQTISEIVRQRALQFARELQLNEPNQSIVDGSFEKDLGTTWKVQTYLQYPETVRVTAEHAKVGKQSLVIEVKDADDVRCMQPIALKARTRYRLSGWVKTRDVVVAQDGGSTGACLSVEDIGISKSVVGTAEWQELQFEFDSGDRTEVELGPRLGTNGSICTGTAWFDELSLVELTDESVAK